MDKWQTWSTWTELVKFERISKIDHWSYPSFFKVTWIDSPNGGHVFSPEKVTYESKRSHLDCFHILGSSSPQPLKTWSFHTPLCSSCPPFHRLLWPFKNCKNTFLFWNFQVFKLGNRTLSAMFYELLQNENHPNQFGCSFSLLNNFMCKKNMACFRMERGEWHRHRTSECLNISDTKTQLMRLQQVRSPNSKASSERRSKLLYDVVWTCGIHILHSKRQYLEHEYNHRIQEIFNRTHWTDP